MDARFIFFDKPFGIWACFWLHTFALYNTLYLKIRYIVITEHIELWNGYNYSVIISCPKSY